MTVLDPANPFAQPSALPYELSPFADIRPEHYVPAIEAGMAERLAALDELAANHEPATEANVIEAWESSGQVLGRALSAFYNVQPADTTDELDAIDAEISPKLARFSDAVYQNRALFDRLTELARRRDAGEVALDPQAAYWLETHLRDFERSGVHLPEDEQQRLRDLNARIAELQSAFGRLALAGSNAAAVHVTDEAELAGWSAAAKDGARAAAEAAGLEGWLIELDSCTPQRAMPDSDDRGCAAASTPRSSDGAGPASTTPERSCSNCSGARGARHLAGVRPPRRVRGQRLLRQVLRGRGGHARQAGARGRPQRPDGSGRVARGARGDRPNGRDGGG